MSFLSILRKTGRVLSIAAQVAAEVPVPGSTAVRYVGIAARIAATTERAVDAAEQAIQGTKRGAERLPLVVDSMANSFQEVNELLVDAGKRISWDTEKYKRYVASVVAAQNELAAFRASVKIEDI